MQKKSNSNAQAMEESLKNRTFGKTVIDALDNLPQTKTAISIPVKELYSSPKKWNFYEALDDNKKLELMESIQDNGILSPIIVWNVDFDIVENEYSEDEEDVYELDGSKYLILAGHNRVDAFNKLYEITNEDKYLKIPAFIFKQDELTTDMAREIVVDTNYVQRSLSTKEKVKSVMFKYAELEKNKTQKGRTKEIVAESLNMSPSMVQNYKKLSEVIEPLQEMVYDERLTLTSVLKVADKTKELQQWMHDTYKDVITSKILNKIKPYMKRGDIENIFEKELQPKIITKKISVDVPEDFVEEFKTMFSKWIYEKTKRN